MNAADIARQRGGKPVPGGFLIRCPVPSHGQGRGDRNPSCTIADGDRGLLVDCKCGCDPRAILDALGYRANGATGAHHEAPKPFSDRGLTSSGYRQTAVYDYTTPEGDLLYQVLRYEHPEQEKTFRQRRPIGSGGWCADAGSRKVLYRWPDLARHGHTTVYVTEGEKDADRLASLGFLAVTVASGSWSQEAIEALRGYQCLVMEDNDRSGRDKARKAARALYGIAASVRVVRMPGLGEGHDVSDWLDQGGTPDRLREIAAAAPLWRPEGEQAEAEKPEGAPSPIRATPFVWIDPATIPPREFIYGRHMIRQFVSTTIAHGGVGKSGLEIAEALAMVSGKPLLGIQPKGQLRVWYWNGEDPIEEIQRRVMAAAVHYGLSPEDIGDRLFIDSGRLTPIVAAVQTRDGAKIAEPVVEAVIQTVRANKIDVVILDPFVSSHRVTENDNNAIEMVAKKWAQVADVTGCAMELPHHSRKTGGADVTVEDGRGAVALLAAARSARVLNVMSEDEAERAEIQDRKRYFRVDSGKANLSPPADKADWFRFVSVHLANGDSVGVPEPWTFPGPFDGVSVSDLRAAQIAVSQGGPWRENSQAADWVGKPIAAALNLDPDDKAHVKKITGLLKVWIGNGMFVRVVGKDAKRMEKTFVEVGQWASD